MKSSDSNELLSVQQIKKVFIKLSFIFYRSTGILKNEIRAFPTGIFCSLRGSYSNCLIVALEHILLGCKITFHDISKKLISDLLQRKQTTKITLYF